MCTALKYKHFFCRNFDYEQSYDERLIYIPQKDNPYVETNLDIIGMCTGLSKDFPLLYDGMNSSGLCMAGLSFPKNAAYTKQKNHFWNVPSYEFILEVLSSYHNIEQVIIALKGYNFNITDESYKDFEASDLHWIISDKNESIVVEQTEDGLNVYENPFEVLTNNPPFPYMSKICSVAMESSIGKYNRCDDDKYYMRGMNTFALNGSYTSIGRFQRAAYLKNQLLKNDIGNDKTHAWKLIQSTQQINGVVPIGGKFEYTIYSVVYDMNKKTMEVRDYDGNKQYLSFNDKYRLG